MTAKSKLSRKFDVSNALKGCANNFPRNGERMTTIEYLRRYSQLNSHVPVTYKLNGIEVTV